MLWFLVRAAQRISSCQGQREKGKACLIARSMGQRRYPPLTPTEVVAILQALGFIFKRQVGSHKHFERAADGRRPRSIVTVDVSIPAFPKNLLKSMIRQSNFNRKEFYGATDKTKKKISN